MLLFQKYFLKPCYQQLWVLTLWIIMLVSLALTPHGSKAATSGNNPANRAKAILESRCFQCHGKNGKANKNIFVLDRVRLISSRVVVPGNERSLLLKVVEDGTMPLGGPELTGEDISVLHDWVMSGAPEWDTGASSAQRPSISESAMLSLIEDDLEKSRERSRPFLRYFSLAHLANAGVSEEELNTARMALSKLLNSLSFQREISIPQPIDPAKTILRIDLRDYNWTPETWNTILSVYPYGIRTSAADFIASQTKTAIPYVRADWFVATASQPPLYHDLLGLPATLQELERNLAVDVNRNLEQEKNVVRAGIRNSGVSQNNRVVERHASQFGAYWKSYDFKSSAGDQNIFKDPLRLKPNGGEVIFNLPNGLQAYFIADAQGRRLDTAPIEIVSDRNSPDDPLVRNGISCMSCHYAGIKLLKDDVREVTKTLATTNFDREKTLALYPRPETLERLLQEDQERFRQAIEKTGGNPGNSPQTEPIHVLTHRFRSDLTVVEAAAEAGLDLPEFRERVRRSFHLESLGFGQLIVANNGVKREIWEKNFSEVVRELNLGTLVQARKNLPSINPVKAFQPTNGATPADLLRSAQTIFVKSKSNFFFAPDLEHELRNRPEFKAWGLAIVKDQAAADLVIEVHRIQFTTHFPYTITAPQSHQIVAAGEVNSLFGTVAGKIVNNLIKEMKTVRPLVP